MEPANLRQVDIFMIKPEVGNSFKFVFRRVNEMLTHFYGPYLPNDMDISPNYAAARVFYEWSYKKAHKSPIKTTDEYIQLLKDPTFQHILSEINQCEMLKRISLYHKIYFVKQKNVGY